MGDHAQVASTGEVSVSVILPTYNRAALLQRSIDGVLGQSFDDLELIVVDDGSTDNTATVMNGYGDPRLRYLRLDRNRGLSAARNAGLACARGRYLAFQDSDDEWHPGKLESSLRALGAHPDAAVVYGDMIRQLADGRRLYLRSPDIERGRLINPRTRFWQTYMLAMQPTLIRREAAGDISFDEALNYFEDLDFHLRLAMNHTYVHLREPLVTYHETGGLTADPTLEFRARRYLLRKYRASLRREAPGMIVRESVNITLRRSLMPIVRQHLEPM
ncbi:glycosyltransferase family 2 protein [Elongatibacter sediminis]|uniref:Glycosyltransferase family 2 protein n=1 Tax=Elongatibacter sediminis TaxID=3119006 RepID=A0AAW9R6K9_9GAMM